MSEYNPNPLTPDRSPDDSESQTAATYEEDEQAKGSRYYDEAAQLYLTHLQPPHSAGERLEPMTESWLDFESTYEGSFEGVTVFVDHCMRELGWLRALQIMSAQSGIPAGALRLDTGAVYNYLSRYFHIFCTSEKVLHVFTRPGVKPMVPDIAWRGGPSR